jgi:hypothetical protein
MRNNAPSSQAEPIKKLLSQAAFWHGTGARQYKGDKRDPKSFGDETIASLESILRNGLVPNFDPLNDTDRADRRSVSVSSDRKYAQLYARMFLNKREKLAVDLENRALPFMVFAMTEIRAAIRKRMAPHEEYSLREGDFLEKIGNTWSNTREAWEIFSNWTRSITKNPRFHGHPLSALSMLVCGFSDIPGNFPVLIGIKPDDVVRSHGKEGRFRRVINPSEMSHIEVPLTKVEEVRQLVRDLGIDFKPDQVVAMEDVEKLENLK